MYNFRTNKKSEKYNDFNWVSKKSIILWFCQLDIAMIDTFIIISIWLRTINMFKLSKVNISRKSNVYLASLFSIINKISFATRFVDSFWLQNIFATRMNSFCEKFFIVSLRCVSENSCTISRKFNIFRYVKNLCIALVNFCEFISRAFCILVKEFFISTFRTLTSIKRLEHWLWNLLRVEMMKNRTITLKRWRRSSNYTH